MFNPSEHRSKNSSVLECDRVLIEPAIHERQAIRPTSQDLALAICLSPETKNLQQELPGVASLANYSAFRSVGRTITSIRVLHKGFD